MGVHMGTEPKALLLKALVSREAESQKDSECWVAEQEQGSGGALWGIKEEQTCLRLNLGSGTPCSGWGRGRVGEDSPPEA